MDINSKPCLVAYSAVTLISLGLVQWLLLPEVGLPTVEDPFYAMMFEHIFHGTGAFVFGNAALYYYRNNTKVFWKDHYGIFLLACTLQHVGAQFMHEFVAVGTRSSTSCTDIWDENQITTTYGIVAIVIHCLSHKGPLPLFRRLAHQPTPVFGAMMTSLVLTVTNYVTGWMTGTFPADSLGMSFFERVAAYCLTVALLGFLVVQYILYQQALAALEKKID